MFRKRFLRMFLSQGYVGTDGRKNVSSEKDSGRPNLPDHRSRNAEPVCARLRVRQSRPRWNFPQAASDGATQGIEGGGAKGLLRGAMRPSRKSLVPNPQPRLLP